MLDNHPRFISSTMQLPTKCFQKSPTASLQDAESSASDIQYHNIDALSTILVEPTKPASQQTSKVSCSGTAQCIHTATIGHTTKKLPSLDNTYYVGFI